VPPQNPVDRTIVDVSVLGVKLGYPMLDLLYVLLATARSGLKLQRELALENLALRQQLAIVQRKTKRPRLTQADRAFWVALCGLWPDWHNALIIVKPETVIRWHRKGFKLYWTWKSRHRGGRPRIDAEIRTLIRRMARENPTWRAPRIHGELLKLGFEVAEATVSRTMPLRRKPPSQTWRAFLWKHLEYYHGSRTHLALGKDTPDLRQRESADGGKVIALPMVGGLHHRYTRRAA